MLGIRASLWHDVLICYNVQMKRCGQLAEQHLCSAYIHFTYLLYPNLKFESWRAPPPPNRCPPPTLIAPLTACCGTLVSTYLSYRDGSNRGTIQAEDLGMDC